VEKQEPQEPQYQILKASEKEEKIAAMEKEREIP
jgi:hypothetical protein